MYTYMTPQDAWHGKKFLIGRPMAHGYWCRGGKVGILDAEMFRFMFKPLRGVEIGPQAYTLVFTDGTREELISYDTVCVYTVILEKS